MILVLRVYGSRLYVIVFFNYIYYKYMYYLIAGRQYFAIVIILADQNHVIRLLKWNNIAMYVIYWIIFQPYCTVWWSLCIRRCINTSWSWLLTSKKAYMKGRQSEVSCSSKYNDPSANSCKTLCCSCSLGTDDNTGNICNDTYCMNG